MGCFWNLPSDAQTRRRAVQLSRGARAGLWGMGAAGLGFRTCAFVRSLLSFLPTSLLGFFSLILLSQFLVFFLGKHEFSLSFLTCEISVSLGFVPGRGDHA